MLLKSLLETLEGLEIQKDDGKIAWVWGEQGQIISSFWIMLRNYSISLLHCQLIIPPYYSGHQTDVDRV